MKKKQILLLIFFVLLLYPLFRAYELINLFSSGEESVEIRANITEYQLSIWLSWVGMMLVSVFYKWAQRDNFFFKLTYFFLVLAFGVFGYFTQHALNVFGSSSRFSDSYTSGVFTALQNLLVAVVLTIFLQIAVSLFQTKWHRR